MSVAGEAESGAGFEVSPGELSIQMTRTYYHFGVSIELPVSYHSFKEQSRSCGNEFRVVEGMSAVHMYPTASGTRHIVLP